MRVPIRKQRSSLQPPMTPMIDVVFLLMVFFVWTSSFDRPELDLTSQIAEKPLGGATNRQIAKIEPPKLIDEVMIQITESPPGSKQYRWLLQGQPVETRKQLNERIQKLAASGGQPPVIILPEPTVPLGIAVEVYDEVIQAGLHEVLFAANP